MTLKDVKPGMTVKVIKINGEGNTLSLFTDQLFYLILKRK